MTDRTRMYNEFLRSEGYVPEINDEGNLISFKIEGLLYLITVDENDEEYFRIVFPNFWSLSSWEEREKAEKAALTATAQTKVAKVFPVDDNIWATIDLFCSPPENFKTVFTRSLSALRAAVSTFTNEMRK